MPPALTNRLRRQSDGAQGGLMDFLFGADMPLAVRFIIAFIIVLALIVGTAFLVRRFGGERLGASLARGRQPRLAVIDATAVDGRRRLILIRRDNVEHLLMIGGPSDVVVEANIVRATASGRDAPGQRPQADQPARAAAMTDVNMWPLQPENIAPPRPTRQPAAPAADEPVAWPAEPEPPAPQRRVETRAEPHPADQLAGLAAELARAESEAPKSRPQRERAATRTRGQQQSERQQPERQQSERSSERARAPAPPAAADDDLQFAGNGPDQNLAEMAQRLEAALRRPRGGEAPDAPSRAAAPDTIPEPAHVPMTAEPPPRQNAPAATAQSARGGAKAPPQRSVYDSLEQEMASLLGRPNSKN